jgi:hypothetical protein
MQTTRARNQVRLHACFLFVCFLLSALLCPEIMLRLVLGGVSWFVSLEQRQACAGKRLFYEWFIMAVCVVFGSEQSPRQASFAKHSLPLA